MATVKELPVFAAGVPGSWMFWGLGVRGDSDPRQSRNSTFSGKDRQLTHLGSFAPRMGALCGAHRLRAEAQADPQAQAG